MIQIPECLAHLPQHSGLPVPYVTGYRNGKPDFRLTDPKNHRLAQSFRLCGICGRHIAQPPLVFSVGPLCLEARLVFEAPMHAECARAAYMLCPFLARRDWQRSSEVRPGSKEAIPYEELPPKPERLGLAFVESYSTLRNPDNGFLYAILPRGEFPVQWWRYDASGKLVPGAW